jgi:hypothetical protein
MKITLKMLPTDKEGMFIQPPCTSSAQVEIDLAEMSKFTTLKRTGEALVLPQEIEVLRRSIPRVFSEMFGIEVIEIGYPDGRIEIWDKAKVNQ